MRDGFIIHNDTLEQIRKMTPQQIGELVLAMDAHYQGEDLSEVSQITDIMMTTISKRMDADAEAYEKTITERSEAGKKGAAKRWSDSKAMATDSKAMAKNGKAIANDSKAMANDSKPMANDSGFGFDSDSVPFGKDISGISDEIPRHPEADPEDLGEVMDAWNGIESIPPIKTLGTTRKRLLKARLREYGLPAVLNAVENIRGSTFLQGDNKNQWVITFDWFVKPSNFAKVLEGNYKNKASPSRLDVVDSWV